MDHPETKVNGHETVGLMASSVGSEVVKQEDHVVVKSESELPASLDASSNFVLTTKNLERVRDELKQESQLQRQKSHGDSGSPVKKSSLSSSETTSSPVKSIGVPGETRSAPTTPSSHKRPPHNQRDKDRDRHRSHRDSRYILVCPNRICIKLNWNSILQGSRSSSAEALQCRGPVQERGQTQTTIRLAFSLKMLRVQHGQSLPES